MWDIIDVVFEALFQWLFQRRHQWIWIPFGMLITAVGVVVMSSSRVAGFAILTVGLLAATWGLAGGVFRRGDE